MMNVTEASNEVKKFARVFQAFQHIDGVLSVVAGLEQNQRELVIANDRLRSENELVTRGLNDARLEASNLVEDAKNKATKIVSDAKNTAGALAESSEIRAKRVSQEAASFVNEATAARDHLKSEHDDLAASIVVARTNLSELNDRIAKAKAAAAEIAKG